MVSKRILILSGLTLTLGSLNANAQQSLPRPIVLYRPVTNTTVAPQAKVYTTSALPLNPLNSPTTQPRPATINAAPVSQQATSKQPASQQGASQQTASSQAFAPQTGWQQTTASNHPGMSSVVPSTLPNSGMLAPGSFGNSSVQQTWQAGADQQRQTPTGPVDQAGIPFKTPEQEWAAEQKRPTFQAMLNPSAPYNMTHTSMSSGQQYSPNTYLGTGFDNWTNQQPISQSPSAYGELPRNQPPVQFGGYTGPNTFMGTGFDSWTNMSMGGIAPAGTGSWDFSVWPR